VKLSGTLQMALGVSVLLHALLLAVRWVDPAQFDRIFQDTPLEVILVNSKANERPDTAQAIAQFSLAGGGGDDKVRTSSPLPPSALTDLGDPAEEVQRKIESTQAQQMQLLTQIQKQLAAMPPPMVARMAQDPAQAEREEKRRQLMNILAEIEKRINAENERPKKRYGELTMALTVNANGQLLASEVMRSSGNLTLDRQAQSIALRSAPFGRFTPEMQRQADQIVVVSRFTFTRDDTLQTQMSQR
jgi:protein TonB